MKKLLTAIMLITLMVGCCTTTIEKPKLSQGFNSELAADLYAAKMKKQGYCVGVVKQEAPAIGRTNWVVVVISKEENK